MNRTVIINGRKISPARYKGYDEADFNLDRMLDCGQCFRWEKNDQGIWETPEDIKDISGYFDLGRDYSKIRRKLSKNDPVMKEAIRAGKGIRILKQDRWETLLSFIISQNNNIPRIKGCISTLSETLGEKGQLPTPAVLARATVEDLAACRLGYRDKYLIETARQIEEDPEFLDRLAKPEVSSDEAAEVLQKLSGVGPKVANCIALFGLGKIDSFPIDVWMKRVMNQLYGIPENDVKAMKEYAAENFAPYGGIAQQYLFYYITHKEVDKR
ncbi:MAG: DNA-3-methyladenine glycosylase 2 family protein [Firmicutes bacterium]|nr:DNA-3-methyladenine glycosylase 2 family protein [Bacillota bacterium]